MDEDIATFRHRWHVGGIALRLGVGLVKQGLVKQGLVKQGRVKQGRVKQGRVKQGRGFQASFGRWR